MNNYVAEFKKVSTEQFKADVMKTNLCQSNLIKEIYDNVLIPTRATKYSAGYDFFSPFNFTLKPKESIVIPTGIRCKMNKDIVLFIVPRSSLGFKYRMQLDNTIGVIDSDYYNSDNEGHIKIKITNDSLTNDTLLIKAKESFCQGIFVKYYLAKEIEVLRVRNGGLGSTNEKK